MNGRRGFLARVVGVIVASLARGITPALAIQRKCPWRFPVLETQTTTVEALKVPMRIILGDRVFYAKKVVNSGHHLAIWLCGEAGLDSPAHEAVDGGFETTESIIQFLAPLPKYEILPDTINGQQIA